MGLDEIKGRGMTGLGMDLVVGDLVRRLRMGLGMGWGNGDGGWDLVRWDGG